MSLVPFPPPRGRGNRALQVRGPPLGRPCRLLHSLSTGGNPPAGGLLKDCGAHFPARPGPRSAGVEPGKPGGRPKRSRRPQTLPPRPKGVPPAGDSGAPGARESHARRPQGPALTGGGSEHSGARAETMPPSAPGRAVEGAAREAPNPGEVAAPPQPGPTRPREEGGSGRLSGRTSVEAQEG